MKVLRIDSSAQTETSVSRRLADRAIAALKAGGSPIDVAVRDLSDPIPQIDATWVDANGTPEADRTPAQRAALTLSDELVEEIAAADLLIIGAPVYNFGPPASLKLWIDQICRARRTFAYGDDGPVGLMTGKRALVCFASGGTPFGADIDFASGYLRHILGFIGVHDVDFAVADGRFRRDDAVSQAERDVDRVVEDLLSALAPAA